MTERLTKTLTDIPQSRNELSSKLGISDRQLRHDIRTARREGIPIVSAPNGGYYISDDDMEIAEMISALEKRSRDMLYTASRFKKYLQAKGQIKCTD